MINGYLYLEDAGMKGLSASESSLEWQKYRFVQPRDAQCETTMYFLNTELDFDCIYAMIWL